MITKENIIKILQLHSYNVEDQAGNHLIVVGEDSFDSLATELRNCCISDVSSRACRIAKAREVYENISSLYDTFDAVGNDDLQEAKTLITNYILKLEQC